MVSLIFLIQIVGYGTASFMGNYLHTKFGRHKFAIIGGLMQCVCYSLICWAPPFPVMVFNGNMHSDDRLWDIYLLDLEEEFLKLCISPWILE